VARRRRRRRRRRRQLFSSKLAENFRTYLPR